MSKMSVTRKYIIGMGKSQEVFGEKEAEITAIFKNADVLAKETEGRVYFYGANCDYISRTGCESVEGAMEKKAIEKAIAEKKKDIEIDMCDVIDFSLLKEKIAEKDKADEERKRREQEEKEEKEAIYTECERIAGEKYQISNAYVILTYDGGERKIIRDGGELATLRGISRENWLQIQIDALAKDVLLWSREATKKEEDIRKKIIGDIVEAGYIEIEEDETTRYDLERSY